MSAGCSRKVNIMQEKNWTLRKADASDAEALTECMYAAYRTYSSRLEGKTLPPMTVDYAKEISTYLVWVAESDQRLVGGLILMPEKSHMNLANIAVHPKFQGNGLGRDLMAFAESEAKRQGYSELRLATHVMLTENISLYEHLGWSVIDRDEKRVYMRKELNEY